MTLKRPRKRATRVRRRTPSRKRIDVTRAEFNHVIDLLNERGALITQLLHDHEIQFKRIAQLQAEIDELRNHVARGRRP